LVGVDDVTLRDVTKRQSLLLLHQYSDSRQNPEYTVKTSLQ